MNKLLELRKWASKRYEVEVLNRPDNNIHKETLKITWQQILRKLDELNRDERR